MAKNCLLASHGTEGAQAAERMALQLCSNGDHIHQLVVVPDLWKGMTGDDWLNNGSTRNRFREYLESQLDDEVTEQLERMRKLAKESGVDYSAEVVVGDPAGCLIEAANERNYDIVVMGSPRPKYKRGLRSRMKTEPLVKALSSPLMIAPYPE